MSHGLSRRSAAVTMGLAVLSIVAAVAWSKMSKAELREALKDDDLVGEWNYDDIDGAFARARKSGKPVCVVFR